MQELELKNVCLSAGDHLTVKGVILHHANRYDKQETRNYQVCCIIVVVKHLDGNKLSFIQSFVAQLMVTFRA